MDINLKTFNTNKSGYLFVSLEDGVTPIMFNTHDEAYSYFLKESFSIKSLFRFSGDRVRANGVPTNLFECDYIKLIKKAKDFLSLNS